MKNATNHNTLKAEILALHKAGIQAHLEKNVDFFIQDIAGDYISVSHGEINRPALDDIQAMFTNYLTNTTFTTYEDVQEPIIGISDDGSLAWSIAQVRVSGRRILDDSNETDLNFTSAWLMLYARQGDKWVRLADVSTFKT